MTGLWEEVYGPDHPLTEFDVPVLDNGACRMRWLASREAFVVEAWVPAQSAYVEQCRVTIWRDSPLGTYTRYDELLSAGVEHYTPERAILKVRLGIGTTDIATVYVTLARGWTAPRFEAYPAWSSAGQPGIEVRWIPAVAGDYTVTISGFSYPTASTSWADNEVSQFLSALLRPELRLVLPMPLLGYACAAARNTDALILHDDTQAYGSARKAVAIGDRFGFSTSAWVSAAMAFCSRQGIIAESVAFGERTLMDTRATPDLVAR